MKKILGLDIGVSSVGLAIVEDSAKGKKVLKMACRVVPEDPNFHGKFYSGNTASKNLARTEKRGIRRNNQRFKTRRNKLYALLRLHDMFPDKALFLLDAYQLYGLRAKAVEEKISLKQLGRILILLNQRRGFLSNRKSVSEEESSSAYKDRIAELENDRSGKTIGQQLYQELQEAKETQHILLRERTYLRASYVEEFDRIWNKQQQFYPELLSGGPGQSDNGGTLYDEICNKTIYWQNPLKSQKGLVSACPFEKHHKAVAKSSPYFEIFRIWQKVNDLNWKTESGEEQTPSEQQKEALFNALFYGTGLNKHYKLTITAIKKILGFSRNERVYLSHTELDGSRTYSMLKAALIRAGVDDAEQYLFFNLDQHDEKGGLFELWHLTYSLPDEQQVVSSLMRRFGFTEDQSQTIARSVGYTSDYGRLSTRAIRKLLPYLQKGLQYSEACDEVGYDHSGYKTKIEIQDRLLPVRQNSLRNPVVEQILNQMVNMVNIAIDQYGPFDEIRVELARELRNNAQSRKRISAHNAKDKKTNDSIRTCLKEEYGFKIVNNRDIKRYKLWQETKQQCLYCNNPITVNEFLQGQADIEHILPKSRSFSNAMNNYILAHRTCNKTKDQRTAYDFMASLGEERLHQYIEKVNALYKDGAGSISKVKFENLLCRGEDIPSDFVERMKKDSQYIAREAVKLLKTVCEATYTTTGQITDLLRKEWELEHLLREINLEKYKLAGQVEMKNYKNSRGETVPYTAIKNWSKRDDHRHHAVDALICALTDQKVIFRLNNLNKIYQYKRNELTGEELASFEKETGKHLDLKEFIDQGAYEFQCPIPNLRAQVKHHLENLLVSFKKSNSKVLTPNIDQNTGKKYWTPRGRLHEETVMGKVKRIAAKPAKLDDRFRQHEDIVDPAIKELVIHHLEQYDYNPRVAFTAKILRNYPLRYKGKVLKEVKVYEKVGTKRIALDENITHAQVKKLTDQRIRHLVERRIAEAGSIKQAFRNLDENPVWLNQEKGIKVKRITVFDENTVIQTSVKRDHFGKELLKDGRPVPTNNVATGGNHHALVYKNHKGDYTIKVISFWEAVGIGLANIEQTSKPYPVVDRSDHIEWGAFRFSMQINDLFVFDLKHRADSRNDDELDFLEVKNLDQISCKLFRIQKISVAKTGQTIIDFRHHLETRVDRKDANGKSIDEAPLKGITWNRISGKKDLGRITKIRLNHLGNIIKVGE